MYRKQLIKREVIQECSVVKGGGTCVSCKYPLPLNKGQREAQKPPEMWREIKRVDLFCPWIGKGKTETI